MTTATASAISVARNASDLARQLGLLSALPFLHDDSGPRAHHVAAVAGTFPAASASTALFRFGVATAIGAGVAVILLGNAASYLACPGDRYS
jgi:hypothetical protein